MRPPDTVLDLAGRRLVLRCGAPALPLRAWLGAAARPGAPPGPAVLVGAGIVPPPAPNASLVQADGALRILAGGGSRWARVGDAPAVACADLDRATVTVDAATHVGRPAVVAAAALLLTAVLRRRRLQVLHAAAVRAGGGAVLLLAPSGGGKSTAAWRLSAAGLPLLADDAVLLDGDAVHGLGAGVTLRSGGRGGALPRIATTPGKTRLPMPRASACRLRAVVVLEPPGTGAGGAQARALAPSSVLAAVLASAPLALDPDGSTSLRAMARRLAGLPALALAPGSLDAPLRPVLEEALTVAVPG